MAGSASAIYIPATGNCSLKRVCRVQLFKLLSLSMSNTRQSSTVWIVFTWEGDSERSFFSAQLGQRSFAMKWPSVSLVRLLTYLSLFLLRRALSLTIKPLYWSRFPASLAPQLFSIFSSVSCKPKLLDLKRSPMHLFAAWSFTFEDVAQFYRALKGAQHVEPIWDCQCILMNTCQIFVSWDETQHGYTLRFF